MIITKQKDFDDLLKSIGEGPVFIIGCSECATICKTGGEDDVKKMENKLKKNNIETTGWIILEPACNLLNDKRLLKKCKTEIEKAKKVLVLACGNGIQTVSEIVKDIDVIPGTDTLFLGEIKRLTDFEKRCVMCGECIQDLFEGVCPISRCPKSMLNGPCGGSINGKCEVSSEMDCVWDIIYKKLKEKGQLNKLKKIQEPKNWGKSTETRRVLQNDL
jgi:ferredoxin